MAEYKGGGYSALEFVTVGWRVSCMYSSPMVSVKGRCYYISQKSLTLFNEVCRQCLYWLCKK